MGQELVRAGWLEVHIAQPATEGSRQGVTIDFYRDLAESSRDMGRKFEWDAILPTAGFEHAAAPEDYRPRDDA